METLQKRFNVLPGSPFFVTINPAESHLRVSLSKLCSLQRRASEVTTISIWVVASLSEPIIP